MAKQYTSVDGRFSIWTWDGESWVFRSQADGMEEAVRHALEYWPLRAKKVQVRLRQEAGTGRSWFVYRVVAQIGGEL